MNINNQSELKAFFIMNVLEKYAEKTGKALEVLTDLFMANERFRELIMKEVEHSANQVLANF